MEQLFITIKNGKVEIEVEGAKGIRCLQSTQAIEYALGKVEHRSLKSVFYRNTRIEENIHLADIKKEPERFYCPEGIF